MINKLFDPESESSEDERLDSVVEDIPNPVVPDEHSDEHDSDYERLMKDML